MRENTSLEDGATVALDAIEAIPEPVFVDDTGKRRRRIRLAFYAVGAVSLTYAGLVAVSLLGGPLKPESLLPFPQTFNRPANTTPSPMTGEAAHSLKKTAHPGVTPHPSGKPGTANPANAIVAPPTLPVAGGTPGPGATPTPEATPTPTPTPTPSPNPPTPTPSPAPSDTNTNTNPAPGGQGGGGATGQGAQPEDTNTGTVVPIETNPVAATNPAPTNPAPTNPAPTNPAPTNPAPTNPAPTGAATETATQTATSSESTTSAPTSNPAPAETSNPAPSDTASPAALL